MRKPSIRKISGADFLALQQADEHDIHTATLQAVTDKSHGWHKYVMEIIETGRYYAVIPKAVTSAVAPSPTASNLRSVRSCSCRRRALIDERKMPVRPPLAAVAPLASQLSLRELVALNRIRMEVRHA